MVLVKGEERDCHNNALMLLATGEADYACTGYALSDDGLWRHHGWGYCLDGTIVETTTPRIAYYGFIDLSKEEFDKLLKEKRDELALAAVEESIGDK